MTTPTTTVSAAAIETTEVRDCNTCVHHIQAASLNDIPSRCWSCTVKKDLPLWESRPTENPDPCKTSPQAKKPDPLETQVGGDHYKNMAIQPLEFALANHLDLFQLNIVKYVTRRKGGLEKRLEDLEKARHYLDIYKKAVEEGTWK